MATPSAPVQSSELRKAIEKAVQGGKSGAMAMTIQVLIINLLVCSIIHILLLLTVLHTNVDAYDNELPISLRNFHH